MICLQDAAASPQDRPAGLTAADAAMSHTHTPPEIVWQRRQSRFERNWILLSNRKHRQVVSVGDYGETERPFNLHLPNLLIQEKHQPMGLAD